ncbi:MAG: alkaline phosphatase family protein, partial [Deltaproteobacteria bacterium]|nr:alkaline phosphatase family protein [Deltaproteobacteria bacterium]
QGRLFRKKDDRTLVIVASDHGQSATHTHIDLEGIIRKRFRKTMSYKRFATRYFDIDAVVMPSGNGMANVYFRGNCWSGERPDLSDLSKPWCNAVNDLLQLEGIDILAYRKGERGIVIKSARGEAEAFIGDSGINYVVRGKDPFGWPGLPEKMTFEVELALTFDTDYPDALVSLLTLMESRRSGDMIVTSKIGYDLRNWWEYQEPRGSHGSLHREHSLVPLLTNAPIDEKPVRTVDIFPMILKLTGKEIPEGIDGRF